jgi:carbohydrate kinase (thermoresistant glucokinase family)
MGVAGSGKTTVAFAVGAVLGSEVIDGDDFHPAVNVEKMRAGIPLTDEDRQPWLVALAALVAQQHVRRTSTVLACSALRRSYRDILRAAAPVGETVSLLLEVNEASLRARMHERTGHYMPVSLLESQLETLEPLEPDELGVVIDASRPLDAVVADAVAEIRRAAAARHGTLPAGR